MVIAPTGPKWAHGIDSNFFDLPCPLTTQFRSLPSSCLTRTSGPAGHDLVADLTVTCQVYDGQVEADMTALKHLAIVAPLLVASSAHAAERSDDAAIRAVEQEQARAWNAHDIVSYAALFTEDADVINVLGWHWRSRDELQQKLGIGFTSVFSMSRMKIGKISIKFPRSDVAVAQVRWTMTGAQSPTGTSNDIPEQGIQTQVLLKRAGIWRISAFQNTNSVPERPFPPRR